MQKKITNTSDKKKKLCKISCKILAKWKKSVKFCN